VARAPPPAIAERESRVTVVTPYKVYVVVDREFGEQLAALPVGVPVWIVSAPVNRGVAERLWKEHKQETHLTGITVFKGQTSLSPEELLLSQMETIDLHHGFYSATPPYTILEVLGVPLSERIKAELSQFGFDEFDTNASGSSAVRPLPSEPATGA
jgi:hypothetical protein